MGLQLNALAPSTANAHKAATGKPQRNQRSTRLA